MINIEELYHALNLTRLKSNILNWVKKDKRLVSRIALYLNADPSEGYVLVAEVSPFPEGKTKDRQEFRQDYRKKNYPDPSPPSEKQYPTKLQYTEDENATIDIYNATNGDCAHLWNWLPDAYENDLPKNYRDQWIWFNVIQGEELDDEVVQEHSEYVLYEEIPKKTQISIPTPPKTIWKQITIRIVNEQRIEVTTPNGMVPWTAEQLGIKGKNMLWPLLIQFARENGILKPKDMNPVKANVSNLRNLLKKVFPHVKGTPIKNYKREDGYICNFNIRMDSYGMESVNHHDHDRDDIKDTYLQDILPR